MTPLGLEIVKQRLAECSTLDELRAVWDTLGIDYKRAPEVVALKDAMKEILT